MTHIVIHQQKSIRESYLLKLISKLFKRDVFSLDEIENNPDIHFLHTKENSIGIEDVKKMQKEMIYKPFGEVCQICIIPNASDLTEEAQNAFLKTLEEQPETTTYILLLDNERNVLNTILSRGSKHYLEGKGENNSNDIVPKILSKDLIEQFSEIEKVSSFKTKEIIEWLENLQRYFEKRLKESLKNGGGAKNEYINLKYIQTAMERIRGNGNKRLVLENLVLQISEEES